MNRLLMEVKTCGSVAEKIERFLSNEEGLTISWQRPKEDFFGNQSPQGDYFRAFAPYFSSMDPVIRSFVPTVWYTRALNGIYHYHKKNNERILVLVHYQNDEGKGFAACIEFTNGKGNKIAYLHN